MCGIIPLAHCADSRVSSSTTARSTLSGASPIATNAASQLHMCGYSNGAAVVITPRSLPRSRYAARAASCVGAKLWSGGICSMMRRARPNRRSVGWRHADRDDHRGLAAGSVPPSPPRLRRPTPCSSRAGRRDRLDALAEEFGATTWPIDLADTDAIPAVVEPIVELDVLIHNAGVAYPGRVAESTVDEWRATMQVNVVGAVALTLALLPALRAAGGHVVFINSGAGINASPGLASYSASKFALRGFADSLRNDEPSLRVTSIHPGRIATVMQEGLIAYEGKDYDPSQFLSPESVAKVVADAVNAPPDAHIHEVVVRPR